MNLRLRKILGNAATAIELLLAAFLVLGILLSIVGLAMDSANLFSALVSDVSIFDAYAAFFSFALQLVIAVEFIMMLVKHTAESVVDVLLFAIARKIVVSHASGATELLIGVVAIAILLLLKYYLFSPRKQKKNAGIFSGSTLLEDFSRMTGRNIPGDYSSTIGEAVKKLLSDRNLSAVKGRTIEVDGYSLQVKSMNGEEIGDIEIRG